jgi:hypothetical protein
MVTKGRPAVRLALLDDASGVAIPVASEILHSDNVDLATQLHQMSEAVVSRMKGFDAERAVIRLADWSPYAAKKGGSRLRLLAEGAVISAARGEVVDTHLGNGKELGALYGSDKAGLEADAMALAGSHAVDAKFLDALGAALTGLRLP